MAETYPIVVFMPNGEVRRGRYRWLLYGEPGADGNTLRVVEWDPWDGRLAESGENDG